MYIIKRKDVYVVEIDIKPDKGYSIDVVFDENLSDAIKIGEKDVADFIASKSKGCEVIDIGTLQYAQCARCNELSERDHVIEINNSDLCFCPNCFYDYPEDCLDRLKK